MNKIVLSKSDQKEVLVIRESNGFRINKKLRKADFIKLNPNLFHCILDNKSFLVEIVDDNNSERNEFDLRINGKRIHANLLTPLDQLLSSMGISSKLSSEIKELKAPMPGLILEVLVDKGDKISKGDPILILEAMKMENVIKSPIDSQIKEIRISAGQSVSKNQVLIDF